MVCGKQCRVIVVVVVQTVGVVCVIGVWFAIADVTRRLSACFFLVCRCYLEMLCATCDLGPGAHYRGLYFWAV